MLSPPGISSAQRAQSDAHVRHALDRAYAASGGRLILVLPAKGARATVASWGAQGGANGRIRRTRRWNHPRNYTELAERVRAMTGL